MQAVLRRYRMPLLRYLDQNTDLVVRRTVPRRYEHPAPGDLVHVDIKTLGRIPDGGGHRDSVPWGGGCRIGFAHAW